MKRSAVYLLFITLTAITTSLALAEDCQQAISRSVWTELRARDVKMRQEKEAAKIRAQVYAEKFEQTLRRHPEFLAFIAEAHTAIQTAKTQAQKTYQSVAVKMDPTFKYKLGAKLMDEFKTFLTQTLGETGLMCSAQSKPFYDLVTCETATQISYELVVTAPSSDYRSQFGVFLRTTTVYPFYLSAEDGLLEAAINSEGYVELSGTSRQDERSPDEYLVLLPGHLSSQNIYDRIYSSIRQSDDLLALGRRLILQQLTPECQAADDSQVLGSWSPLLPILRVRMSIPVDHVFPSPLLLDGQLKFVSYPRYASREATLYFKHGQFIGALSAAAEHIENKRSLSEIQIEKVRDLERGNDSYCWIRATFPEKLSAMVSFPKSITLDSNAIYSSTQRTTDRATVISAVLVNTTENYEKPRVPHILRLGCKVIMAHSSQTSLHILVGTLREALGREGTSLRFTAQNEQNPVGSDETEEGELP